MKKLLTILLAFTFLISVNAVFAADESVKLQNPIRVNSVKEVLFLAVDLAVYIGVSFAILAIIYVGFLFVMAQGKPEKLNEAKMYLLYIIIGLAILISSKVIVVVIQNTLIKSGVVEEGFLNTNI